MRSILRLDLFVVFGERNGFSLDKFNGRADDE